jgi:hypothetical protein
VLPRSGLLVLCETEVGQGRILSHLELDISALGEGLCSADRHNGLNRCSAGLPLIGWHLLHIVRPLANRCAVRWTSKDKHAVHVSDRPLGPPISRRVETLSEHVWDRQAVRRFGAFYHEVNARQKVS